MSWKNLAALFVIARALTRGDPKPISTEAVPNARVSNVISILTLVVAILSLIVTLVSLKLYFGELHAAPDVVLEVSSPMRRLGEVTFNFDEDNNSSPQALQVLLSNRGDKASQMTVTAALVFSPEVNVSPESNRNWVCRNVGDVYHCVFDGSQLLLPPHTRRQIGQFGISIRRSEGAQLLAFFFLQGDYEWKEGLFYYDPVWKSYDLKHFTTPNSAASEWNAHLRELRSQ